LYSEIPTLITILEPNNTIYCTINGKGFWPIPISKRKGWGRLTEWDEDVSQISLFRTL